MASTQISQDGSRKKEKNNHCIFFFFKNLDTDKKFLLRRAVIKGKGEFRELEEEFKTRLRLSYFFPPLLVLRFLIFDEKNRLKKFCDKNKWLCAVTKQRKKTDQKKIFFKSTTGLEGRFRPKLSQLSWRHSVGQLQNTSYQQKSNNFPDILLYFH